MFFDLLWGLESNPNFCVPSQFINWSALPLEPPSETYVSALHDIWSTKASKLSMALSVNWTSLEAKSFVQLQTHSCLKPEKSCYDISERNLLKDSFVIFIRDFLHTVLPTDTLYSSRSLKYLARRYMYL